jgi:hypothetical protein
MRCSDQCYGEIGSRPPTIIGGLVPGLQLGAYTEVSSVSQGAEKRNYDPERWQLFSEKIMFRQTDEIMIRFQSHQIVI